jgi:hypothetical protein
MRDLVRGKQVRFMEIGPYDLGREHEPRSGVRPRRRPMRIGHMYGDDG